MTKTISLQIEENKFAFVIELLRHFSFIQIIEKENEEQAKQLFAQELNEAMEEIAAYKAKKTELIDTKDRKSVV